MAARRKNYNWWLLVVPRGLSPLSLATGVLITNRLLPSDIDDVKQGVWNNYPVPGKDFSDPYHVRNDNLKVSFTVPIVNINDGFGNSNELNAIEKTRSVQLDLSETNESAWRQNPICIYSGWGTNKPPLPVRITNAPFRHKRDFTNVKSGFSQYTEVSFEMTYIESSVLFQAWMKLRDLGAFDAMAGNLSQSGFPFGPGR